MNVQKDLEVPIKAWNKFFKCWACEQVFNAWEDMPTMITVVVGAQPMTQGPVRQGENPPMALLQSASPVCGGCFKKHKMEKNAPQIVLPKQPLSKDILTAQKV